MKILISRLDHLGDILLTLPMAGILKNTIPGCRVDFLISNYALELVQCCTFVDTILSFEDCESKSDEERMKIFRSYDVCIHVTPNSKVARWAYFAGIKRRIGTSRRWFHFLFCNERIYLKRKNASIHESLLNLRLLKNLIPERNYTTADLIPYFGLTNIQKLPKRFSDLLEPIKFKLIIHTLSLGNTRHWSLSKFKTFIEDIPISHVQIILTGSKSEQSKLKDWIETLDVQLLDLTGQLKLGELIGLISSSDGIVSNTTGPMHISAVCGIRVMGIFPNYTPMHPDRWGPIGVNAEYVVAKNPCSGCPSDESCACMKSISTNEVLERIMKWIH